MSVSGKMILIVEDEKKLAQLLSEFLQSAGYQARIVHDGNDVINQVRKLKPDLVLLDLMLPGKDGLDITREIRGFSSVPIIMTTARVEEIDRLLGLEMGADDYVCKPYSPREVVARVKAHLRRSLMLSTEQINKDPDHSLLMDSARLRISVDENFIELTAVEFSLLEVLYQSPGRIFSRDQLMDRIYDDRRVVSYRTIDSHVKKIRKKLLELLPDRELIHSVYGVGYRYENINDS
ncbi:MAG: response regulator [Gammaproteobacteria bacterium]|nr:MAG: response regulator [Gammaproteobacteria bacterium]